MEFKELDIEKVCLIEPSKLEDERGFFARSWDKVKFDKMGLSHEIVQCNISFSTKKGTIRGMHYQISPYEESKLIRCTRGRIFDVVIDLRENSKTYKNWISQELSEGNYKMLYVPEGCAHGFLTLEDNTEVFYQNTAIHMKEFEKGIRWDDPTFSIKWPECQKIVSQKDQSWGLYQE